MRLRYYSELDPLFGTALWTMNPDGTGLRRLTREASDDYAPAWSPDGRRVAFTRAGLNGGDSEIDAVNSDGSGEHRVTGGPKDTNPAWSPDARRIAFMRETKSNDYLAVVNADGTGVHLLRNAYLYGPPSWSPDGRQIVYSEGQAIVSISPDGTHRHALLRTDCPSSACADFRDPAFSPDGARIAFSCQNCAPGTPIGLWTIRSDGTALTLVTAGPARRPSWSPDGTSITFDGACQPSQPLNSVERICIVDADGANLRALTTFPFDSYDASWSPR